MFKQIKQLMIKKCCILFLIIVVIWSAVPVTAHQNQNEHDSDLQKILFGEGYPLTGEPKKKFQAIANAASLCIDQYSSNDNQRKKEGEFNDLNKRIGFSFSFDDIELKKDSSGNSITPNNHRWYTHRGWDFPENESKNKWLIDKWGKRKKILTATANKELFGKSPGLLSKLPWGEGLVYSEKACNNQCEAFCELVYYVHILGDYEEAKTPSPVFIQQLAPLYRPNDNSASGIIPDIINLLPDLFNDQPRSRDVLVQELEKIESKVKKIHHDNIQSQEEFDEYRQYALDLEDILEKYIPDMLRREDFFRNSFY